MARGGVQGGAAACSGRRRHRHCYRMQPWGWLKSTLVGSEEESKEQEAQEAPQPAKEEDSDGKQESQESQAKGGDSQQEDKEE